MTTTLWLSSKALIRTTTMLCPDRADLVLSFGFIESILSCDIVYNLGSQVEGKKINPKLLKLKHTLKASLQLCFKDTK